MACNSLENTALHLRNKEQIIDRANRISPENIDKMQQLIDTYTLAALQKYGVNEGNLFTIEEVATRQLSGHANHRDNIKTYFVLKPNIKAFEAIDDIKESIADSFKDEFTHDGYSYMPQGTDTDTTLPHFTKYIQYKRNQIVRLEKALFDVKVAKNKNRDNAVEFKRLIKLEQELSLLVEGDAKTMSLADKLDNMEKTGFLGELEETATKDLELAEKLARSDDFYDIGMAKETIELYERFGNFNVGENNNPMFDFNNKEDLFYDDKGNLKVDLELVETLSRIGALATRVANIVNNKEDKVAVNVIANHSKVKRLGLDLTHDKLFPTQGIKDTAIFDMFFMDITNGIRSDNGLVAKFMQSYLEDVINKSSYKSRVISQHLDKISAKVTSKLRKVEGGKYAIGIRGASYDYFRQKDANGNYTGRNVGRYSHEFHRGLNAINQVYFKARMDAFKSFSNRKALLNKAARDRDVWLRENGSVIDINQLQYAYDLMGTTPGATFNADYEQDIINEIGEKHYAEIKEQTISKLKEYKVQRDLQLDNLLVEEGVANKSLLSLKSQRALENWQEDNSPFLGSAKFNLDKPRPSGSLTYNTFIPNKDNGAYDETYADIEQDEDLLGFHKVLQEFRSQIDELPSSARNKIFKGGIPSLSKGLSEILMNPDLPYLMRISEAYRKIIDNIIKMFTELRQDENYKGLVNPITGQPDYKVNDDFIVNNQSQIDLQVEKYMIKLAQATDTRLLNTNPKLDLTKLSAKQTEQVYFVLMDLYKVSSIAELKARLPTTDFDKEFNVKYLVTAGAKHQVILSETSDMPKIIKHYTNLISEYQARTEALPLLTAIKKKYENISDVAETSQGNIIKNVIKGVKNAAGVDVKENRKGLLGKRANAINQIDSWFKRVALGNYSSKFELGDGISKTKSLNKEEKEILGLLEKQEAEIRDEIDNLMQLSEALVNAITPDDVWRKTQLEQDVIVLQNALNNNLKRQGKLGANYSIKKGFDAIFTFNRFKGLGYNLNSYLTNFFEGQTANFLTAASGDYFRPELIYRANRIASESTLKGISKKLGTRDAIVTRILIDRYDILQDQTNELQKASNKSAIGSLSFLAPMAGTQKVEYVNQAPLMLGVLMDTEIKGVDNEGNEVISNVFDAFKKDGNLKKEFDSEENRNNWVDGLGQEFLDRKGVISKAIGNTHGTDYNTLRGSMAKEYTVGKAFLMFKGWLSRQIYSRFGVAQIDLEAEIDDFKGRYLSHDVASGSLHGAILSMGGLSLIGAGFPGMAAGALVGAGWGIANRVMGNHSNNLSATDTLKELAFLSGQIIKDPLRRTVNTFGAFVNKDKVLWSEADYGKRLPSYSSRDIKNIRVNIAEMSMTLVRLAGILIAKAMLWDDDDDEESKRRRNHNHLVNKMMTLADSLSMYSNPKKLLKNLTEPAILTLFKDVNKVSTEFNDYWLGNDTLLGGKDEGSSALGKATKKLLLPKLIADPMNLGFGTQRDKQFQPNVHDALFWGEDKVYRRKTMALRAIYKADLINNGVNKDLAKEFTKERYPGKDSNKSQLEWYEEIKNNPEPDASKMQRKIDIKNRKKAIELRRQENIRKYKESLK